MPDLLGVGRPFLADPLVSPGIADYNASLMIPARDARPVTGPLPRASRSG